MRGLREEGKTVILVTHQLQLLQRPEVDRVALIHAARAPPSPRDWEGPETRDELPREIDGPYDKRPVLEVLVCFHSGILGFYWLYIRRYSRPLYIGFWQELC